jgi:hypothetical protein
LDNYRFHSIIFLYSNNMSDKNLLSDLADNKIAQSWMDKDFFESVLKKHFDDDGAKVSISVE